MTMAKKTEARLFQTIRQAGQALHKVGALDTVTMREIDTLSLPKPRKYTAQDIVRIRVSVGLSQPVFARLMGVGKSSVTQWEQGVKTPSGPVLRLLETFDRTLSEPSVVIRMHERSVSVAG